MSLAWGAQLVSHSDDPSWSPGAQDDTPAILVSRGNSTFVIHDFTITYLLPSPRMLARSVDPDVVP